MYNLLRARNLKLLNTCNLSKRVVTTPYRRSCTLCCHITYTNVIKDSVPFQHGRLKPRHSSTYCSSAVIINELKKRKKYVKQKKRFIELLEVVSGGHSETVARVKNLNPNHVTLLAQNPDITLEHLYDLKINRKNKNVFISGGMETSNVHLCSNIDEDGKVYTRPLEISPVSGGYEVSNESVSCSNVIDDVKENSSSLVHSNLNDGVTWPNSIGSDKGVIEEELEEDLHEEIHDLDSAEEVRLLNDPAIKEDLLKEIKVDQKKLKKVVKMEPDPSPGKKNVSKKRTQLKLSPTGKEKLAKIKSDALLLAAKQKNLNSILLAYIDTCVSCGFLNRGLATLQFYIKRSKYNKNFAVQPSDIKIFDALLQGFASKGKYEKLLDVWEMFKILKLKPSVNSYAARIECIIHTLDSQQTNELEKTISEMLEEGISLNDIFDKSTFLGDQRKLILDGIQKLYPDFVPEITTPDLCYSCSLLNELNKVESDSLTSPVEEIFTAKQLKEFGKEQFTNEIKGSVSIKSVEKRLNPSPLIDSYREKLKTSKLMWEKSILKAFERDINVMNAAQNHTKSFKFTTLFPYLKVLEPDQFKDIIMEEITKLAEGSESFSPTTGLLYKDLGLKVYSRYIVKFKERNKILDKTQKLFDKYCEWYADPKNEGCRSSNSRQEWQKLIYHNQEGPTINIDEKAWPHAIVSAVGKFLYNIILHDIKIDVNMFKFRSTNPQYLPAFYTIFRQQSNRSVEEIKPHPILSRLFRATEPDELLFDVKFVPMVCPPLPWTSPDSGGYLLVKTDFVRLPSQAFQQRERIDGVCKSQLYPCYDSLNQLSCVPWKVNCKVLDIMTEVFNNGGSSKLDVPEPPSACPMPEPVTPEMTKSERFQNFKKRLAVKRKRAEMYSLWCDALYRLSLANHFRGRVFWLPHNMDFRGRVYPCPPHLNHLGSDLARSLLCFAKGKPLGETGLDWLKIHAINLTGLKKKNSVIERLMYANEIMDEIVDSAQNPLSGRMWWAKSETPWQTLACCIEIWEALQHPGGPKNFISHFPVHQDGSCNGLQHYAALGRDKDGAASVNLTPSPVPQDVYSCVAAIVEKQRSADAEKGVKVAQQLDGFIQRKVIKQTVMTTVYGVTRFGARLQIAKQLKDMEAFPKDYVWSASTYLVGKTFESLRQMFTSTREIQDWFTECARLISQVCGQNVEYVTPLGLPVVQPYVRRKQISVSSNIHGRIDATNTSTFSLDMFERPNVMKQKNAFPPNFIHSLDSSHMMLTSLHCEQEGITFVSVHDCFWTHPCSVSIMNRVCREQFVALHSQPILEDLSTFLLEKFGYPEKELESDENMNQLKLSKCRLNNILQKVPPKGEFQLENVMDSLYFFS